MTKEPVRRHLAKFSKFLFFVFQFLTLFSAANTFISSLTDIMESGEDLNLFVLIPSGLITLALLIGTFSLFTPSPRLVKFNLITLVTAAFFALAMLGLFALAMGGGR